MDKDIYDQFLARFENQPEDAAVRIAHEDPAALLALQDELAQGVDPLAMPQMNEEQRDGMAGKRIPETQDLLFECADGIRQCPEIGREVGAGPEVFENTARQDMSIGGFIKGLQAVRAGAEAGLLHAAGEGDELCDAADRRLESALGQEGLDRGAQNALKWSFAEAIRVREEAWKEATGSARKPAPAAEAESAEARETERRKALVTRFLSDLLEGKDELLSRALRSKGE